MRFGFGCLILIDEGRRYELFEHKLAERVCAANKRQGFHKSRTKCLVDFIYVVFPSNCLTNQESKLF